MKKVLCLVVLGVGLANFCYADLTKQDIEEIRRIVKEEIEHVDKRIDGLDKRIDGLDKRIDELRIEIKDIREDMKWGFGILLTGIFVLMGFILWDRRTALAPAVKKAKEIEEREERIEMVLKKYAIKEPRLGTILREAGIL